MGRILIVDDSGTARKFIRRCLEMSGCDEVDFAEAENGMAAMEILTEQPADLVVSDMNMPVMNGAELLEKIKAHDVLKDISVILITSAANPALRDQLMKQGALEVLGKPISPAEIFPFLEMLGLTGEETP